MLRPLLAATALWAAVTEDVRAQNYPQFRGANSDAVTSDPLPANWSDVENKQTNIKWKIPVAGEGWSQPIVWENRLFVSAAVPLDEADQDKIGPEVHKGGYGRDRKDLVSVGYKYVVLCFDADTGNSIWECVVKQGKPPLPRHSTNTYATETPVTDGQNIYAYFGMSGVHCVDFNGNLVWQKDLGVYEMNAGWGTASSPTLYEDRLFIQVDNEKQSFLIALDTKSGEELWRVERDERSQYSSPIIWKNSVRNELILGGMVYRAYDPATGDLLWQVDMNKGRSSATPVAFGDRLYIGNEFRNRGGADDGGGRLFRVKPGGAGDITPKNGEKISEYVEWRVDNSGIQMASPTYLAGNLYFFERNLAVVHCVDAETGRIEYKKRVPSAREFWASPWTDGKHLFAMDSNGNTHVLAPGDEFRVMNINKLDQHAWGTPAIVDGRIYLRTATQLYCIADE